MTLRKTYSVDFTSDGTDTMTLDISKPPLNIEGAQEALDVVYGQKTVVPAAPFIKEATLDGTELTVKWAANLPVNDISQLPAVYTLGFTLTFES